MNLNFKNLEKIKSDASFRIFFRKKNKKKKSIIVYADREKKKNLLIYDAINQLLLKNNILSPKLYNENYSKNYIEIQDFGNESAFVKLKKKNNKRKFFKKIISLLIKIQNIKQRKIKDFKKKNYKIPIYTKKLLTKETNLFFEWYVSKLISKKEIPIFKKKFQQKINYLLSQIKLSNNTFVHRDFHVSNLIFFKKKLAIIDSQDALIGNKAYDLASVIDDVRIKTSKELKYLTFKHYLKVNEKKLNKKNFKNDFEILSVLRNLKIIGIFTRLSIRDKKHKYLKLIPHAWGLIESRIENNLVFKDLKEFLDYYFPKKIRIKK